MYPPKVLDFQPDCTALQNLTLFIFVVIYKSRP
jgi:hypothetical protein